LFAANKLHKLKLVLQLRQLGVGAWVWLLQKR